MYSDSEIENIRHVFNFKLSNFTTYKLGGKAKVAYFPKNLDETIRLFNYFNDNGINNIILGRGSNVLVSDAGYDGAVIFTSKLNSLSTNDATINCESGVSVCKILNLCKTLGLSGLEYLAGIPASIGGIIYMNGGTPDNHICKNINSVTIYDGCIRKLSLNECNFGNKHSIMRDINCIILSAELSTEFTSRKSVSELIDRQLKFRSNQPKGHSCGCVFINPDGLSAGKLIDSCGLKGLRVGGAFISPLHANFIINDGGTAADVYTLINETKRIVYDLTGIKLKEEVVYIGEFNDFNG